MSREERNVQIRRSFVLSGCLLALLVPAGCNSGDDDDDSGGKSNQAAAQGVPATFKEGSCTPGGQFVMGVEAEPATLLPASSRATGETPRIDHLIYSQLVELDPDGEARPSLAKEWEVSDDNLTYTFKLADAKWHDGEPVTSEDVKATVDYLQNANVEIDVYTKIRKVDTPDEHTVVMHLSEVVPGFLTTLANVNESSSILPAHLLEHAKDPETSDLATHPVGSGPFKFVRWQKGSQIELARNEDYFEDGRPCLDNVTVRFMPDAASRKISYEAGEVDWLYSYMVPLEELPKYAAEDPSQVVRGGLGVAVTDFLVLNTKNRYLADQTVRQAIMYAIDREQLNELAFSGFGKIAHSTMNSELDDLYTDEFDSYSYDVERANQMLDEAGFERSGDSPRFSLNLRVRPDRPFESRMADALRTQLGKVGIDLVLQPGDAASVYDLVYTKFDFDMVIQLRTTGPDPSTQMPFMFTKQGVGAVVGNAPRYNDPELEELFSSARTELDADRRKELWSEIQDKTMQAVTWAPLVEYPDVQLVSPEFENVIVGPLDYVGNLEFARQASG
jgi:peptide/nickel transport system substrate-binding protein